MPSMIEAATIRDLTERHAYVFRAGLSDRGFFDLEQRRQSEEFAVILQHVKPTEEVLEVGCLTGLNLLLLAERGNRCQGIECVAEAVDWLHEQARRRQLNCRAEVGLFPGPVLPLYDVVLAIDVLEHQLNVGRFLDGIRHHLRRGGRAIVIVPKGREYYDCGHAAFWPDAECLTNTLAYFFDVVVVRDICGGRKMFALCQQDNYG